MAYDLWGHLMLPCKGKGSSKSRNKIKISLETFGYFGKEREFFAGAWPCLILCVLLRTVHVLSIEKIRNS